VKSKEAPLHIFQCGGPRSENRKPTRIGFKTIGEGATRRKVRIAKGSGVEIDG